MFHRTSPSRGHGSPRVTGFHDPDTGSIQYVVDDPETGAAALIDIVLDYDPEAGRVRHDSAKVALDFVRREGLTLEWILDTHPHADHLMAAAWLKEQTGAPIGIGAKVREIARMWERIYNMPGAFDPERDFDRLFADGDTFRIGSLPVRVMLSPGHTLGSVTYVVGSDAAFVHDTLMHVDVGSSRADFPGGDAGQLWDSIQRILELPEATRLFVGHDYPPVEGREEAAWEATVAEHRSRNPHVNGKTRNDFVALRKARDADLPLPDRMLAALQINLRGGRLPVPESDGHSHIRIPLGKF